MSAAPVLLTAGRAPAPPASAGNCAGEPFAERRHGGPEHSARRPGRNREQPVTPDDYPGSSRG